MKSLLLWNSYPNEFWHWLQQSEGSVTQYFVNVFYRIYMPTEYSALLTTVHPYLCFLMPSELQEKLETRYLGFAIDLCIGTERCNHTHNYFSTGVGLWRMISETAEALNCHRMTWLFLFFFSPGTNKNVILLQKNCSGPIVSVIFWKKKCLMMLCSFIISFTKCRIFLQTWQQ